MGALWFGVGVALLATLAVVAIRRTRHTSRSGEVDVGAVSESWLSEQRARKDS